MAGDVAGAHAAHSGRQWCSGVSEDAGGGAARKQRGQRRTEPARVSDDAGEEQRRRDEVGRGGPGVANQGRGAGSGVGGVVRNDGCGGGRRRLRVELVEDDVRGHMKEREMVTEDRRLAEELVEGSGRRGTQ